MSQVEGVEQFLFKVISYGYGEIVADERYFYVPELNLKESCVPLSMVLDNNFEMYIDSMGVSSTYKIYRKGEFLGISSLYSSIDNHHPYDVLQLSAGVRNSFMLGSISESGPHKRIEKYFSSQVPRPTDLNSHFSTFKEIANLSGSDWRAKLMVFPDEITQLLQRREIDKLTSYILDYDNRQNSFASNRGLYQSQLTRIKSANSEISSNTFVNDVVEHLFAIGAGHMPGYSLAMNEESIPFKLICDVYKDVYKVNHTPYIMIPEHFSHTINLPVFYSVSKDEVASKPHIFSNQPLKCDIIRNTFCEYSKSIIDYECFKNTLMSECAHKLKVKIFNEKKVSEELSKNFYLPKDHIYEYDTRFEEYAENLGFSKNDFPLKTVFFTGCFGLKFDDY